MAMYNENVVGIDAKVSAKKYDNITNKKLVYHITKRVYDIIVSLLALIVLAPFFLVIAILIKLDSKGPVLLNQKRIGKNGKLFRIYKFRSMDGDYTEEMLMDFLDKNIELKEEYLTNKKLINDPRITRIGKFLRRTSIDELPQLINVLIGNMSLVGPRPYLPYEKNDIGVLYNTIIKMTPGITGLWQVTGRANTEFYERCMLDVQYYRKMSIKEDTKILFKTFKVVFKKIGAL